MINPDLNDNLLKPERSVRSKHIILVETMEEKEVDTAELLDKIKAFLWDALPETCTLEVAKITSAGIFSVIMNNWRMFTQGNPLDLPDEVFEKQQEDAA